MPRTVSFRVDPLPGDPQIQEPDADHTAPMNPIYKTIVLLTISNFFMTYAWYGHLKSFKDSRWWIAALASWGVALFEYLIQVPANRIGHKSLSVGQLKILQEVISLTVFVPFAVLYLRENLSWNYLYAGLCMMGAVWFIFRG